MKKIILSLITCTFLFTAAVPAFSQIGIKGGLNIATVSFDKSIVDASNITGFHIGPMYEATIPIIGVGFDVAVLYSQRGLAVDKGSMKQEYIEVPLNLKWKMSLPIIKPYIAVGPYFGFNISGEKVWEAPSSIIDQIKSKSFSTGLNIGAGVELFSTLQIGATYGFGLTKDYKIITNGKEESGKNRGWSITAVILF